MKIGDEVYVHGYVDEIRNDVIIIRNDGGYFGTVPSEIDRKTEPQRGCDADCNEDCADCARESELWKAEQTENSSEKPNNCIEPQTEDLQDWKDRMWAEAIVTEPQTEYERGKRDAWDIAQKVFDSTVTLYEAEDVAKQIKKDEPNLSDIPTTTDCAWK